jgi:DNA-directed RNA polymerase specialized sigma24 family protein
MSLTHSPVNPRPQAEKNKKFANDGSYESVQGQIKKLAFMCFARVNALGLGMTFEDVLQEMNLSYVNAKRLWNPEGTSRFSTYLQTACLNNFNARIEKPERERRLFGMVNMSDMQRNEPGGDDSGERDIMEVFDDEDQGTFSVPLSDFSMLGMGGETSQASEQSPFHANPEALVAHRQDVREAMAKMSPNARAVVMDILRAAHAGEDLPRFGEIAAVRQIKAPELRRLRIELANTFGVKI